MKPMIRVFSSLAVLYAAIAPPFAVAAESASDGIDITGDEVPIAGARLEPGAETVAGSPGPVRVAGPPSSELDDVRHAIEYAIGWAVEKDFDKMFSIWAQDDRLFHHWLTSSSTTFGFDAFASHAEDWRDPRFRGTTFSFRDLEITFSRSGDVAWYSCRLDDCFELDGVPGCVENVLQTGVLEKRDGRWVHVLMHGSYPVDEVPPRYIRRFYADLVSEPVTTPSDG